MTLSIENAKHAAPRPARRTTSLLAAATLLAALAAGAPATAQAQGYPERPITFVVPFAAGSATDQIARALGQSVSDSTKQPVVVDNKGGASGMIAAQQAAKAKPDGYTVLITTNTTHAANEHLYKKLPYDPVKDFVPVTGIGKGGQVLVVRADAPYKSVADLLAKAGKEPGKLSFGSGSSSSRVAGEMFKQLSKTDILHVPYKSNPSAITDLLGGQIDMMITDTSTGVPQVKAGKLRALGVSTSKRIAQLPDVPTIAEAGVPGYDMGYWFAAYVPAGTPAPVVERLRELLIAGTQSPGARQFYETSGGEPFTTTSAELGAFQQQEAQKWGRVIKAAGIEPE
ncbi:MAG: Bug family tripartite tricarboxylate transporter substrate binding protein [Lautropia sp.]